MITALNYILVLLLF